MKRVWTWLFAAGLPVLATVELSVATEPPETTTLTLALPKPRQIIQRGANDTASLRLQGTLAGGPVASVEARAVVMPGATNNGVSTDWRVIARDPTNGLFVGVLSNLTAGGWYRVEVRALAEANAVLATTGVDRVGVGDVFVTAGQSNAGCFGNPMQRPSDDRVSAYMLSTETWRFASDPQPNISGGMGTGGSPWPILGGRLVESNGVPVGFVGLAYGATEVVQWAPGTGNYRNLTNALRRLGPNGVRAVLWHQGESDSLASTSAQVYFQRLSNIVVRSREAAGWSVPWGIAEVSFHPAATRAQEEAVAAGQRLTLRHFSQDGCFRGPRTDDFNLENKINLSDGVHFNAAGLVDHAQQWAETILGVDRVQLKNGDFEANARRADGTANFALRVIGWNRLNAGGDGLASGANGYFNPGLDTYSDGADSVNGGVLPHMNGPQAGTLQSTNQGNSFRQTLRAHLQPSTTYTFGVALGVRDNAEVFGGCRLEILAGETPVGPSAEFDLAALNALAGGSAAGKFTQVSCVCTSPAEVATNQSLAVRITKLGGAGTYVDFDDAGIASELSGYGRWQTNHWGDLHGRGSLPEADPDGDRLPNLIEYLLGTSPLTPTPIPLPTTVVLEGETWLQLQLRKDPAVREGALDWAMSYDLAQWFTPSTSTDGGLVVQESPDSQVVRIRQDSLPRCFFRIRARW